MMVSASVPLHLALALVGATNVGLLGGVLAWRAVQGGDGILGRLAGLCFVLTAALILIVFVHAGVWRETVFLILSELALTLLGGFVLLDFVCAASTKPLPWWSYAVVPILAAALVFIEGGTETGLDRLAVTAQMGFTVLAAIHWVRCGGPEGERDRLVFGVLTGVTALHVAQAVRTNAAVFGTFEDIVPLIGGGVAVVVTVIVLLQGGLLQRLQVASKGTDEGTVTRFDLVMREQRLFLEPSLTLAQVAAKVGVSPQRLSSALNAHGAGFYERVARYRIIEAKRLLCDSAEARTSIEAIALLSGFKSRSSFYEAFRAETGQTPAAYRKSGS